MKQVKLVSFRLHCSPWFQHDYLLQTNNPEPIESVALPFSIALSVLAIRPDENHLADAKEDGSFATDQP